MATDVKIGILPPPSYRHRQQPPSPPPPPPQQQSTTVSTSQPPPPQPHPSQPRSQTGTAAAKAGHAQTDGLSDYDVISRATTVVGPLPQSTTTVPGVGIGGGDLSPRQQQSDLSYMHRPPAILPNYGKRSRGSVLPKSNVSRVLLYDNITQQTMLDVKMGSIRSQSYKTNRELDMHMKSFLTRRRIREKALKKITRVQHHDDYVQFVQEQDHCPTSGGGFLPHIGLLKTNSHPHHQQQHSNNNNNNSGNNNKKLRPSADSTPSTRRRNNPKRDKKPHSTGAAHDRLPALVVNSSDCVQKDNSSSLPQITVTSPTHDKQQQTTTTTTTTTKAPTNESLPQIKTAVASSDIPDTKQDRVRKVGIQFVKGDKGVTRMFNVVSDENDKTLDKDNDDEGLHRNVQLPSSSTSSTTFSTSKVENNNNVLPFDEKDKIDENNNSIKASSVSSDNPESSRSNDPPPLPPPPLLQSTTTQPTEEDQPAVRVKPRTNIFLQKKKQEEEEEEERQREEALRRQRAKESMDSYDELHPERPTIDSRFLHLRRVLVPQEPPNEGFAELSPSFPKRYPSLKDLSPRGQEMNYAMQDNDDEDDDDDDDDKDSDDENEEEKKFVIHFT